MITVLKPDEWLTEWVETTEGYELWLSARLFNLREAYELLKKQYGVRYMPLDEIELGWIKYGWEDDDDDHNGEELYWRGFYKQNRSYPVWFIENTDIIGRCGGNYES